MEALFDLPDEYKELRSSVRALAEKEIAPHAREVDEEHRYPQEAAKALARAGLSAAHVATQYGGQGADALGVVIIIEEIARVCGSSSLIPAVNKLGSLPLILGGNEEQALLALAKQFVLGAEDLMLQRAELAVEVRHPDFHGDHIELPRLTHELVLERTC